MSDTLRNFAQPAAPRQATAAMRISFWLLALIWVCSVIVIADGAGRPFFHDDEPPGETFQYTLNMPVYLFAFAALPICIAYAASVGASMAEALLLWFVFGTAAYAKDFAYIRLPGVPLYVTDVVLGVLVLSTLRRIPWRKWWRVSFFRFLLAFWIAGFVAFAAGIQAGEEALRTARDAAIVAYSSFLIAVFLVVRNWDSVRRVLLFAALGAGLGAINAAAWFVAQPGQRRYLMFGVYVLAALVGTLVLWGNQALRARYAFPFVLVFFAGLLLANARTTYVALGVLLAFVLALGISGRRGDFAARAKLLAQVCVLLLLLAGVALQTRAGEAFIERALEEFVSGTLTYADDPNAQFRFLAWTEAIGRFIVDPVFGEGFGVPFTFAIWNEDVRPHNTYLTVLYKMGLAGFLPFALLLGTFHWRGWRAVRRSQDRTGAILLYTILIAHTAMCLYGGLNLLLESPFLAAMFWILMGLGIRGLQLLQHSAAQAKTTEVGYH